MLQVDDRAVVDVVPRLPEEADRQRGPLRRERRPVRRDEPVLRPGRVHPATRLAPLGVPPHERRADGGEGCEVVVAPRRIRERPAWDGGVGGEVEGLLHRRGAA